MVFKIIGWMQSSVKPLKTGSQLNSNEIQGMFCLGQCFPATVGNSVTILCACFCSSKRKFLSKNAQSSDCPWGDNPADATASLRKQSKYKRSAVSQNTPIIAFYSCNSGAAPRHYLFVNCPPQRHRQARSCTEQHISRTTISFRMACVP